MKKTAALTCAALTCVAFGVTACGTTSTPNDNAAAVAVSSDPLGDYMDANAATFKAEFCDNYSLLLDAGWNNETIYSEVDAGGFFEGWPSGVSHHDAFIRMVRWCYAN
jgi:hypothetical protein